jgi:hypothetical protein
MAYCPLDHDKVCPICRSVVYLPSPCYSLKSVVAALKPGNGGGPLANEDDPWADIFFEDLDLWSVFPVPGAATTHTPQRNSYSKEQP